MLLELWLVISILDWDRFGELGKVSEFDLEVRGLVFYFVINLCDFG